jgi:hypothetical protein
VLFSDIVIDTSLRTGHWWGKGEPIYISVGRPTGGGGIVRNVSFSNICADVESGIVLDGDPNAWIRDISFDQLRLHMRVTRKDVNAAVGGNFDFRWTSDSQRTAIFKHDIPGLYARHLKGLVIRGLQVQWEDGMPAYYSSALELEDMEDVSIESFAGRQASVDSEYPVISLKRVKDVSIRDSKATQGASTFICADEVNGERSLTGSDLARAKRAFKPNSGFMLAGNILPRKDK